MSKKPPGVRTLAIAPLLHRSLFFSFTSVLPQFFVVIRKNEGRSEKQVRKKERLYNVTWTDVKITKDIIQMTDGLVIGVDAAQQQIDTKVGNDNAEERRHAPDMELDGGMVVALAHVQGVEVDKKGDERPHLFGVPTPVVAPRNVGPYCSDDNSHGEQCHGGIEYEKVGAFHRLPQGRFDECRDAAQHGEEEKGISRHDDGDV